MRLYQINKDRIPTIRFPDCRKLVSGGIRESETPEEGLIREVKEEESKFAPGPGEGQEIDCFTIGGALTIKLTPRT